MNRQLTAIVFTCTIPLTLEDRFEDFLLCFPGDGCMMAKHTTDLYEHTTDFRLEFQSHVGRILFMEAFDREFPSRKLYRATLKSWLYVRQN